MLFRHRFLSEGPESQVYDTFFSALSMLVQLSVAWTLPLCTSILFSPFSEAGICGAWSLIQSNQ